MAVKIRSRSLIIAIGLGVVLLGLATFAATTMVLAVGTIPFENQSARRTA